MRRLAAALCLCLWLTGCGVLPRQTDAADEAILRVVTMSRGETLHLAAVTGGIETGDASEPPEQVEGEGEDYAAARRDMKGKRQVSLTHATDWVVEENALGDLLEAFVTDPELTLEAEIFLLREQTVEEFLAAFEAQEGGLAQALDALDRALGDIGGSALELAGCLAAGEPCSVPVLRAEDGELEITGEVTLREWK